MAFLVGKLEPLDPKQKAINLKLIKGFVAGFFGTAVSKIYPILKASDVKSDVKSTDEYISIWGDPEEAYPQT